MEALVQSAVFIMDRFLRRYVKKNTELLPLIHPEPAILPFCRHIPR